MQSLFTVGVGHPASQNGGQSYTLAELEAKLRELRERGATDDAKVYPVAPWSVYLFEVSWIGESS